MYVCFGMIGIWLKGSSHDYSVMWSERVTHVLSVSKVKGLLLTYEHIWAIVVRCLHKSLLKANVNLCDD